MWLASRYKSGTCPLGKAILARGHLGGGRFCGSLMKIIIVQVEAGLMKNHSITELENGFVLENMLSEVK